MSEKMRLTEAEKDVLRQNLETFMDMPSAKGHMFAFIAFTEKGCKGNASILAKGINISEIMHYYMEVGLASALGGRGKTREAGMREHLEREGVKWN